MEFENMPESTNVEDRRGAVGGPQLGAGSGGLGLGAIVVLALIGYFTGIDPRLLIGGAEILTGGSSAPVQAPVANVGQRPATAQNDPMRVFVERVLGGTEAVWAQILPAQKGVPYTNATLVLYDGATASGCGGAQAAMGPFYCPLDKKVYLDLSFFRDMQTKYGGGGDFAYAYVIAHEVGHHVQDLLGILDKVDAAKQNASRTQANRPLRRAHPRRLRRHRDRAGAIAEHCDALSARLGREDAARHPHAPRPSPASQGAGRLLVQGDNVMLGYLRASAPGVLEPPADGWSQDTGDIVAIDAAGVLSRSIRAGSSGSPSRRRDGVDGRRRGLVASAVAGRSATLWSASPTRARANACAGHHARRHGRR